MKLKRYNALDWKTLEPGREQCCSANDIAVALWRIKLKTQNDYHELLKSVIVIFSKKMGVI